MAATLCRKERTDQILTRLLRERIAEIDFRKAADEVRVFLHDPRELELWSTEFFLDIADRIEVG